MGSLLPLLSPLAKATLCPTTIRILVTLKLKLPPLLFQQAVPSSQLLYAFIP